VGIHESQGQWFTVIYVAPHPDGFCVFENDGTYSDAAGRTQFAFRADQVFARHGTASEPWNQGDTSVARQRLAADADRGRNQEAEAAELLNEMPRSLGDSGLWLAVAVVPQYHPLKPTRTSTDAAQAFLRDWAYASAPIDPFGGGTPTYRRPGGVVISAQAFWYLSLGDAGAAAGARCLAY
jgi:hypothetical protein